MQKSITIHLSPDQILLTLARLITASQRNHKSAYDDQVKAMMDAGWGDTNSAHTLEPITLTLTPQRLKEG